MKSLGIRVTKVLKGFWHNILFPMRKLKVRRLWCFFVPMEGLTSGFYSTYLALFLGLVILLIGTVSFFILSLKGNINSIKLQEANLYEISRLFDQQNLLLQELKGFVFFHDYHGEITKVSDEVEKVLGHSKLDFKNAFKADSIHPQANLVKAEAKKALAESRDFMDLEYDFAKPTGEKIRVRIFEKFIFDQQGRFSGGMGICTDITSQYLARQETIQSENRLRTVISNIPDTIFIYDNEGVVLDFHVQDKANLLHPAQLTLGKSLAEFVPHGQADEIVRVFNLAKSTNRIQTKDVVWHSLQEISTTKCAFSRWMKTRSCRSQKILQDRKFGKEAW